VILSGVMMLEHLGWKEAAALVRDSCEKTVAQKIVTYDFAREMKGVEPVKASEFGAAIVANIEGRRPARPAKAKAKAKRAPAKKGKRPTPKKAKPATKKRR
jgi:hypothetical protein